MYSQKAKIFNFHASVLERLFEWNQRWQCRSHCLLTYNYRVEKKILDFITSLHYGGKLTAMSVHHRHPGYYPLSFLAVKGHDQLVGTSYINTAEVSAINIYRNCFLCSKEMYEKKQKTHFDMTSSFSISTSSSCSQG